ncbi:TPA: hypothetical protein ACH3X1_004985 [Trebouxia sp. C0004]
MPTPSLAHQYAHQCVSSCDDSHAALHSIGTTAIPLGVMPDPADVNADPAATSGAINVLSPHGLTMLFHGIVSVKDGLLPVRTLVDTGASHCYVSQAYVKQADIPIRSCQNWLKLADITRSSFKWDMHLGTGSTNIFWSNRMLCVAFVRPV